MAPMYTKYEYAKRGLLSSYKTFKLDVARSKGAPQIETEVLIFYHVIFYHVGKQESPKNKGRVLADGGFPDCVLGFM